MTKVPNMRIPPRSRYNKNLTAIKNNVGPFPDLSKIAKKDYELFDMKTLIREKNGWPGLLTSRGCPYKCTYCFNKEIVDQYMEDGAAKTPKEFLRHYPIQRILDEIIEIKAKYPINTLIFDDDLFTLDRKYVHEFCQAYKASGIDLPYVVNAHVQVFDEQMAFDLKDSGCMIVKYGLESGSKRVRTEILWRFMTNERIKESFAAAHKYNLHTSAFIMFGLPTETRAEVMETLQVCADVGMGRFRWALFFPFVGTAGYRISNDMGLIDFDKLASMGNYFDGSALKFPAEMNLFFEKLGRVCNWYVNALSHWPGCAEVYKPLVAEVDGWSREEWDRNKTDLMKRDREISDRLLDKGIRHYSIRYTHVMGVDSDFVLKEQGRIKAEPTYMPVGYTLDD
ncbi:radical SAM protein [bacterium]|nr:radical SAM protein [bacterium]